MNPRETFIHLGLPKTASTSLRFNLFAKHSQVHYLGKHIGGTLSEEVQPAIFHGGSLRQALLKRQRPARIELYTNGKTPVLSLENLSGGPLWRKRLQARRFQQALGPCQILLVIREPVSFLKSFYVQMLRNFQEQLPGHRPIWMNSIGEAPHVFGFDEWLKKTWGGLASPKNYISYADTARAYAAVFGEENVHLFLFEELVHQPEAFIARLSRLLQIDPEESATLLQKRRSNERLTTDYIDRIRAVERSGKLADEFRNATPEERRKILNCRDMVGEKIDPQISEKWIQAIHRLAQKQNRQLLKHWDLPLAEYGYKI